MSSRNDIPSLEILYEKAKKETGSQMTTCNVLYRNKPKTYFDLLTNEDGTYKKMLPYIKDKSGDQKSPINEKLNGLFFSASVDVSSTGNKPRSRSAFGDTRIHVPVNLIADKTNLYFADFYCMQDKRYHYVTLVMTKPGSESDVFCKSKLLELDYKENDFFRRIKRNDDAYSFQFNVMTKYGSESKLLRLEYEKNDFLKRKYTNDVISYEVNANSNLLVEIFFTDSLNINQVLEKGGMIENNVTTFGRGVSSTTGLPKNTSCEICNICPTPTPPSVYQRKRKHI